MALNKKAEFSFGDQEIADFARILSHPARIAIIRELARHESCICGDIVEVLPLAQSTVSQHLKEMVQSGLVSGKVEGLKSCYCLNWECFEKFSTVFSSFFSSIRENKSANNNCC